MAHALHYLFISLSSKIRLSSRDSLCDKSFSIWFLKNQIPHSLIFPLNLIYHYVFHLYLGLQKIKSSAHDSSCDHSFSIFFHISCIFNSYNVLNIKFHIPWSFHKIWFIIIFSIYIYGFNKLNCLHMILHVIIPFQSCST